LIHHFSCLDAGLDLLCLKHSIDYIFKNTNAIAIRLNLYYIKDSSGNLNAEPKIKDLLKNTNFRWKSLINDMVKGYRYEINEASRKEFQEK